MDDDGQWTGNYSGSNQIGIDDHGAEAENYLQLIVLNAISLSNNLGKDQTTSQTLPRRFQDKIYKDWHLDYTDGYGYRGYNHQVDVYCDAMQQVRKNFNPLAVYAKFTEPTRDEVSAEFIEQIRLLSKSEPFKSKQRNLKNRSKQNFKASCSYIEQLFLKCSKLLVLRLDLYYDAKDVHAKTEVSARSDLQHLFNNRRTNALFDSWVGYIAKMEYGEKRGLHFHLIIFLDGNCVKKHAYYAMLIGRYWAEVITDGKGWYNYSNQDADDGLYKYLGIGPIGYADTEKRFNLLHYVVAYLCKKDQFLRAKESGKKHRAFSTGTLPRRASTSKAGRPRKIALVAGVSL